MHRSLLAKQVSLLHVVNATLGFRIAAPRIPLLHSNNGSDWSRTRWLAAAAAAADEPMLQFDRLVAVAAATLLVVILLVSWCCCCDHRRTSKQQWAQSPSAQQQQQQQQPWASSLPTASFPPEAAELMRSGAGAGWSEAELERWWRFADCSAKQANKLLRKHLAWRESQGLALRPWPPDDACDASARDWPTDVLTLRRCCAYRYHKVGRDGHPVLIHRLGLLDLDTFRSIGTQRAVQAFVHECEVTLWRRLPACSAAAGVPLSGLVYVLDMSHFTLSLIDASILAYVTEVGWVRERFARTEPSPRRTLREAAVSTRARARRMYEAAYLLSSAWAHVPPPWSVRLCTPRSSRRSTLACFRSAWSSTHPRQPRCSGGWCLRCCRRRRDTELRSAQGTSTGAPRGCTSSCLPKTCRRR